MPFYGYKMILLALAALTLVSGAANAVEVRSVRLGAHPDKNRIVIELDQITDFRAFSIDSPSRLVVDLPDFKWSVKGIDKPAALGLNDVRYGALGAGLSRMVFEMNKPAVIQGAFLLPARDQQPTRLVIDYTITNPQAASKAANIMHGTMPSQGSAPVAASVPSPAPSPAPTSGKEIKSSGNSASGTLGTLVIKTGTGAMVPLPGMKPEAIKVSPTAAVYQEQIIDAPVNAPIPEPAQAPPQKSSVAFKPMIIIDPGHGGQDPGAKGANGNFEKNITLAVGKRLKKTLEETGKYRVKMTRETDIFIPLRDRVRFARRNGGDLFISIHADSISRSNVTGASVYTLSEKASDAETAKLAARENSADLIAGVDLGDQDQDVANILIDLATRDTMNQSKFMANTVVSKLNQNEVRTLRERPHRSAGFAVLKATDIPSILVEMGYVTNLQEANKLSTPAYQQQIANALRTSVDAYFAKVSSYGQ